MSLGVEVRKDFLGKDPHYIDSLGRKIVNQSRRLPYQAAAGNWDRVNQAMAPFRDDCQIVVVREHQDVTLPLYELLKNYPLGKYPAAEAKNRLWDDHELDTEIIGEAPGARSIYLVASARRPLDYFRVRSIADHYKEELGAQCVTAVLSFAALSRQDKNVNSQTGEYEPKTINIQTVVKTLSGGVDRLIVVEPHSAAMQEAATKANMVMAPVSPWRVIAEEIIYRQEIDKTRAVVVGPDTGRKYAATRLARHLGVPYETLDKTRLTGKDVRLAQLKKEQLDQLYNAQCVCYDDEANSLGTIMQIARKLDGIVASFDVGVAHLKLTGEWAENINYDLPSSIWGTDSREPEGQVADSRRKIRLISLAPWIRKIIEADMEERNFWIDPDLKHMILQEE